MENTVTIQPESGRSSSSVDGLKPPSWTLTYIVSLIEEVNGKKIG